MWILAGITALILVLVIAIDHRIRTNPGRRWHIAAGIVLLTSSVVLLVAGIAFSMEIALGLAMALAVTNAFVAFQRARSMAAAVEAQERHDVPDAEAPYEQFVNTFFSYFNRGDADAVEFEFRNWRMEVRFRQGEQTLPVTDTPFHMLLQIKRLLDAVTVRNAKTGESRTRYVARGMFYEFLTEDIGGTLLRLKLVNKREASTEESRAFDRLLGASKLRA